MVEDFFCQSEKQKHPFGNISDLNPMLKENLITLTKEKESVTSLRSWRREAFLSQLLLKLLLTYFKLTQWQLWQLFGLVDALLMNDSSKC